MMFAKKSTEHLYNNSLFERSKMLTLIVTIIFEGKYPSLLLQEDNIIEYNLYLIDFVELLGTFMKIAE